MTFFSAAINDPELIAGIASTVAQVTGNASVDTTAEAEADLRLEPRLEVAQL